MRNPKNPAELTTTILQILVDNERLGADETPVHYFPEMRDTCEATLQKKKGTEACHFSEACVAGTQVYLIVGLPNRSHVLNASDQFWLSKWITDHRSWEKAMTIVPEITSVDGVACHSQII